MSAEPRKHRRGATLFERELSNSRMQELVQIERDAISLEMQFRRAMESQDVSPARLAEMLEVAPSSVSRDLNGGLSDAKLGRLRAMAKHLNHELIPLVLPRNRRARKLAIAAYLEKLK
jgi:predicted XRE-type DNA-binding protein